jgi:hypothetical protein
MSPNLKDTLIMTEEFKNKNFYPKPPKSQQDYQQERTRQETLKHAAELGMNVPTEWTEQETVDTQDDKSLKFNKRIGYDQRCLYLLNAITDRQDAQNVQDAMVLSILLYWLGVAKENGQPARLRAKYQRKGHIWTVFQYRDFMLRHGLSERQAKHSISRLKSLELIITEVGYSNVHDKNKAVFIRLNEPAIRDAIDQYHDLIQGRYNELQERQENAKNPLQERQREIESLELIYELLAPELADMKRESEERESLTKQIPIKWK